MLLFALALTLGFRKKVVLATIDVNLAELEYLAARLDPYECRLLAAALHFDEFELPKNLDDAEKEISEDISCLRLLLHWNQEARGETHEHLERRLRQLGRADLADWLGRTAFREIGRDLLRLIDEPIVTTTTEFPDTETTTAETPTAETTYVNEVTASQVIHDTDGDQGFWVMIDAIALLLFAVLLFTFIVFVGLLIIDRFARCRNHASSVSEQEKDNEKRNLLAECQE